MNNLKEINDFIDTQLSQWPEVRARFKALENVRRKTLHVNGVSVQVQYNPDRARFSFAEVDAASVGKRPCFLCEKNRPEEQIYLQHTNFHILVNPYPVLPKHLTIAADAHSPQNIGKTIIADMLYLAKYLEGFLVFYNGPQSGASAPDHLHFQAVEAGHTTLEQMMDGLATEAVLTYEESKGLLEGSGFSGFYYFIYGTDLVEASANFIWAYTTFSKELCGDINQEFPINVYCRYMNNTWQIFIVLRQRHRPDCYFADGDDQFLVSPGAIDMAGLIITPRETDFDRITSSVIKQIYSDVSFFD